ncbi:hypothetical protein FIV06_07815 [Labrenzia sp. THAF191b]|uniref:hypothetical protein n=1 Tax=unclassified Labrenzia TaxID=2648686 RepID=UPI0012693377|nr:MULTISPECIES: hypothetical protein [unclassified Labrenzia]QFS97322.1 hypothetical protein FIV06_07815 [Labrenzia sp. THAF191b]QFT03637.1 hypothetical protein FIV05_07815 [Labrenzia sp. THAF191a]QFT15179.1 hypothetical protein FIV03_07820 [Labrenzia sp. THAF187b]
MTINSLRAVGKTDGSFPHGERPLDPFRVPITTASEDFVAEVIAIIEAHEESIGLRLRRRRRHDQLTFERMVTALVSDLAINVLCEEAKGIHLTRSHRYLGSTSRYGNPVTSKTICGLLDQMADPQLALVRQDLGYKVQQGPKKRTVLYPSARLQRMIRLHGLTPSEFGELQRTEPIELKSAPLSRTKRGELVDYPETDLTTSLRTDIRDINRFLAGADIGYIGPETVDLNKRQLRRCFTRESFGSGGRLYGGFWQPMKKRDRLRYIKINGEDVVELDYGQIMPRLVYSLRGVVPRMADLYDIPGFDLQDRPGIKKVMSSMQFVEASLTRFPKETRDLFPTKVKIGDVTASIMAAHPDISDAFFTGIGHRCQFLESQILVEVLLTLKETNIIALPIHDAIIVPASAVATAKEVMLDVFKRRTGQNGVVDILTKQQFEDREEPQLAA